MKLNKCSYFSCTSAWRGSRSRSRSWYSGVCVRVRGPAAASSEGRGGDGRRKLHAPLQIHVWTRVFQLKAAPSKNSWIQDKKTFWFGSPRGRFEDLTSCFLPGWGRIKGTSWVPRVDSVRRRHVCLQTLCPDQCVYKSVTS